MKHKQYFFRCQRCKQRLPQQNEARFKPGVCQDCYAKGEPADAR